MKPVIRFCSGFWLPAVVVLAGLMIFMIRPAYCSQKHIPEDIIIKTSFKKGTGKPVGMVTKVEGTAGIRHAGEEYAYQAKNGVPIHNKDRFFTREDSRLQILLKDGSRILLAPESQLAIDKNCQISRRTISFVRMLAGKARFMVRKDFEHKKSRFNVKTGSALVTVQGSDFVVEVIQKDNKTIISALGNTVLEINDPAHPLQDPVVVTSFQQLITIIGEVIGEPADIPKNEIRRRLEEIGLISRPGGPVGPDGGYGGTGGGPEQPPGGPVGPGGGYGRTGGGPEPPGTGLVDPSLPFLWSGGPTRPLPPPIDDPGPDDTNNDDPGDEILPPAPFPTLPGLPAHPQNE